MTRRAHIRGDASMPDSAYVDVIASSSYRLSFVRRDPDITAADGKTYDTKHYDSRPSSPLDTLNSERAVQFRTWATRVVEKLTIKGFAMDDERLQRLHPPREGAGVIVTVPRADRRAAGRRLAATPA